MTKTVDKKLWSIFFNIVLISFLVLTIVLSYIWKENFHSNVLKQENRTDLIASSAKSAFLHYETLLDVIGMDIVTNKREQPSQTITDILDGLLKVDKNIAGMGLADVKGNVYLASSNIDLKKVPNLLTYQNSRKSFSRTLTSDKMVLGRTYYMKALNTYIVPMRKAIRDKHGKILAILTIGIKFNNANLFLNTFFSHNSMLVRESDYFRQYTSQTSQTKTFFYDKAFPKEYIQGIFNTLEKQFSISIKRLKNEEHTVSTVYKSLLYKNKKIVISLKFIKRYQVWVVSFTPYDTIVNSFLSIAYLITAIFVFANLVIFILFNILNKHEKNKQQALYNQATHDYLTGLKNRYFLVHKYKDMQNCEPFTLYFIDLDHFKTINDNYGNEYGDLLLIEVANRLKTISKEDDIVVRYSGDEFLFICKKCTRNDVFRLATRILKMLAKPYKIKSYELQMSASIGISQFPHFANSFDELKRQTDIALYSAKDEKNTFVMFENELYNNYKKTADIEQHLKSALSRNELFMVYQPQHDIEGNVCGVEALVRWKSQELGFISPEVFIKIAERLGLINELGKFIFETALEEISEVQQSAQAKFNLSLNVSVYQFMQEDFCHKLDSLIQGAAIEKENIVLEITETLFIEEIEYILSLLQDVKKSGIEISLDDFGTGYSSLNLLKKLPIDELKIDKSFIDDLEHDRSARKMVQSIITIAKNLNMKVLAEGVEDKTQLTILRELGCEYIQGYYYSKPLTKEDLIRYVKSSTTFKS